MAKNADGPWFGAPEAPALAQAATAAYYGHVAHARDLLDRARESAKRRGAKDLAAQIEINTAVREVLFGNFAEAKQAAREALDGQADEEVEGLAAIVFALTGNAAQAQKLADDLDRRVPDGTMVQFNYLPAIQAALAFAKGTKEDAVANIRRESPYELAPYVCTHFCRFTCAVKFIWKCIRELEPLASFRKSLTSEASFCIRLLPRSHILAWAAPMRCRATPPKRKPPIKTSSRCGKTPTPTSPS